MKFDKLFSKFSANSVWRKLRPGRNPVFDWFIVCLSMVFFLAIFGGVAVFRFYNLSAPETAGPANSSNLTATSSDAVVNVETLNRVIAWFTKRNNKFDALKNGGETFVDPSR